MKAFVFSLCISLGFLAVIVTAIRRRALRDQMAVLWLAVSTVMLILSLTLPFHLLDRLAHAVGVAYGSDLVLVAAVVFLVLLVLQLSVAVARLSARTTRLAQDIGLLRLERARADRERDAGPDGVSATPPVPRS